MKNLILCFCLSFYCIGILSASTQSDSIILALEDTLSVQIDRLADPLDVAQTHDDLAKRYEKLGNYSGDYSQALKHYGIALEEIRRKILGENNLNVAQIYCDLARIHRKSGNQEKALDLCEKAIEIRIAQPGYDHSDVAIIEGAMGNSHLTLGNYAKALELYNKALKVLMNKLGKDDIKVVYIQTNLATTHQFLGNYTNALELHNDVLKFEKNRLGENDIRIGYIYKNMGNVYLGLGNYTKALERYNKALKILKNELEDKHYEITNTQYNIAIAYLRLKNYAEALKLSDKVLEMRIEQLGEKDISVADSYSHRSLIYMELEDYKEAIRLNKKALTIWRDKLGENHPNLSYSHLNLALIYHELENYEEALKSNEEALKIQIDKLGKNHPDVAISYINIAKTHEALNNHKTADSLWHIVISQNLKRLNNTYLFLSDNQRLEYAKTFKDAYNSFYSFAAKHGDDDTKRLAAYLLLNTKSLALDYSISVRKLINNIDDEELKNLYDELNTINGNISQAELMTDEQLKEKKWNITDLRNQQENFTRQLLNNKTLKEKLYKTPIKWEDAKSQLDPDEAILDFVHFYEESDSTWMYYAMLTCKDASAPQFVHVTDQEAINTLLKDDNQDGQPDYIQSDREDLKTLYQKIWQPLMSHLKGVNTVHLSPSGLLHQIDFGVLQNENENESYLADHFEFHYYTTMRDFAKKKKTNWLSSIFSWLGKILNGAKYKNLLLFGDIAYGSPTDTTVITQVRSGLDSLIFAREEIEGIDTINGEEGGRSIQITGNDATEDTLKHHTENFSPDIIHFATHGKYLAPLDTLTTTMEHRLHTSGNSLQRSMLILSGGGDTWTSKEYIPRSDNDGILTAYEVSHLDLSDTKLVVLSACDTGLGDIHDTEGVLGLQSAFKLAGVEHVIVSLWKVDDQATKELMIAFYEYLLIEKQDAPTALRNAKNEMQGGKELAKWAGFILIE